MSANFDDSRIKDHPDKRLLKYMRAYFKTFTEGDFDGMKALQTDEYTMTDIPLGVVRLPRDDWYNVNKGFTELLTDLKVIAISLYGSSEPGEFAIMEHAVSFKLAHDPPPQAVDNLPPGAKKGDPVGMINISVLWWDANGNVTREFEYGRLTWKDFDVRQWDQAK